MGSTFDAAQAALVGQRFDPNLKELAALRFVYFDKVGNQAQKQAAMDHLRKLDPNFDRKPVMEPITGAMIVAAIVVAIEVAKLLNENWDHFHNLVMNIVKTWNEARKAVGRAGNPSANTP